nr:integrase, catalytic region, zinc finger, CCHC-type, peptidase aspartic, catalytic [Tanacetum cinerariifolium]
MLERTDFESWQQQIWLYLKGKDHGEYILQSIDEGPFKMGQCRHEITSGTDGPYLGPEQDRVGFPKDIYKLIYRNTDAKDICDNVKILLEGFELTNDDRESQMYDEFEHFGQHKVYDEAGPSYDSDTLFEVQDHDNCLDIMNETHEEHDIHNDVQQDDIVDSDTEYTFHDSKDTLKLAETTRKQMIEKMKDPECVKKKVKIAPHNYSKENYLATFTPQKQLTPEQIFWSDDLLKMKAKALTKKAKSAKPITAMTVYPPNKLAKLVPEVLPTKTDFMLNVSRFSDMHDAYTVVQKRIAKLEAENSILTHKIRNDDHDEMIKHFSKLEVEHLNFQLKYQHLKERFRNRKTVTSSDARAFESVFVIGNLKEQLQGRGNTIRKLKEENSRFQNKYSETDPILDFKALNSQNNDLNAKVNALQDLNERFRAENKKVKQRYKELYNSIKLTHAKTIENTTSLLTEIKTLKAQIKGKTKCVTMPDPVKPKVLAPGMYAIDVEPIPPRNRNNKEVHLDYLKHLKGRVKDATASGGSKPRSNTKKVRTLPAKSDKKKVEDHSRNNKSKQKNRVDSSISYKRTVIQIVLWYLDSGCLNHMTWDRSRLMNFVKKFIEIVSFRNDHFGAIMGYGDYVIGDSMISRQNGVVERQNRNLVEAARTMLIFSKALMFLWEEVVATAFYTQN